MRLSKAIFFLVFFFIISLNLNAEEKNNRNYTKYVIENYNNDPDVVGFVAGLGEMMRLIDAALGEDYSIDMICIPNEQSFTADDYFAILKQQYFRLNQENFLTAITLYFGLKNTFPCN